MILAIDWSHAKGLTIYDGKKTSIIDRKTLLKKLAGDSIGRSKSIDSFNSASSRAEGESTLHVQSRRAFNPSARVILEQGCPLSLIYDLLKTGSQVNLIDQFAVKKYREAQGTEKSDKNDAMVIYKLTQEKLSLLRPVSLNDSQIQLIGLYQRYKRYQKARVAMVNMRKAYIRQFGEGESSGLIKSIAYFNPSPAIEGEGESTATIKSMRTFIPSPSDGTLPYDIGIDTLKASENSCLKKIVKLAPPVPKALKIRGLGPRLWAGIIITANPANFPTLSSYLRYCGLVNLDQLDHKWNRHARMLYHMLAEEVMKRRDERFRPVYDKCKADIAQRYPEYTKRHIHNAALNRTATFLAKEIYHATTGDSYVIHAEDNQAVLVEKSCT